MHALHDVLDIRRMGGLRHKMPTTFRTFLIGAAALAGLPPLSGFFSKDTILAGALDHNPILYIIGLFVALLTAFYSGRMLFVAFFGEPRDRHLYDHAHESPSTMTIPLWILAGLAIIAGVINLPVLLTFEHWLAPAIGEHEISLTIELIAITLSVIISIFGVLLAYARYLGRERWATTLTAPFKAFASGAEHKWYVDDFYMATVVRPLRAVSGWFAAVVDRLGIDGLVNGVGRASVGLGEWTRQLQTGAVPTYALSILIGVVAMMAYFVFA
jgi:NADH-quinone oxidoreductase subunit L